MQDEFKQERTNESKDKLLFGLDRLNKNAIRMQIPIGLEDNHEGVVDLLRMKAYYFEGDMGNKVVEKEIPENISTMKSSNTSENEVISDNIPKEYIIISVKDSGIGIPPSLQEKVFTPFFTTKALGEGIGLGLYVTKKIVHEHRGRIYFESSSSGTEFHVVLRKDT